jgi:hypothetical protein
MNERGTGLAELVMIQLTAFFSIHVPHLCLTDNMTLLAECAFIGRRAFLVTFPGI